MVGSWHRFILSSENFYFLQQRTLLVAWSYDCTCTAIRNLFSLNLTSHRLNRTQGWKLTSSRRRELIKDNVRSGMPVSFIKQSIWNVWNNWYNVSYIIFFIHIRDNVHILYMKIHNDQVFVISWFTLDLSTEVHYLEHLGHFCTWTCPSFTSWTNETSFW